jgi:phenylpyruvate tautomerase PptA (4-oxalocrotonate tautomerase family)
MPLIIVKLCSGRTEPQKKVLAQAVTEAVTGALSSIANSRSLLGIEDAGRRNGSSE